MIYPFIHCHFEFIQKAVQVWINDGWMDGWMDGIGWINGW